MHEKEPQEWGLLRLFFVHAHSTYIYLQNFEILSVFWGNTLQRMQNLKISWGRTPISRWVGQLELPRILTIHTARCGLVINTDN